MLAKLTFAALLFVTAAVPAFAAPNAATIGTVPQSRVNVRADGSINPPTNGTIQLSAAECRGLGGKVFASLSCNGKDQCTTVDPNGVVKRVCLTQ